MRKVLPLIVVFIVVIFVVRAGLSRKSGTTNTPDQPTGITPPPHNKIATPSAPAATQAGVPRPSDPAVAAVVDEMLAAWDKVDAVSATVKTSMPEAAGHKGTTVGKGKYWLQKKDGKLRIHFDLRNELRINQDDGTTLVTGEVLLTTIDGQHVYNFINQPGHQQAIKKKLNYDEVQQIAGPYLFRDLVTNNKLSLLPEEMKDGHATKVIKAKPNDGPWETIHHFDKATGIRLEMTEMDAQGQTALQIKLSEVNTNPTIIEDQFKFVVPEGVTLEDQTTSP